MRWMQSQCGRPWDEVYAELSVWRRSGNIAISHVVDTHMIEWVCTNLNDRYRDLYEFIVTKEGTLIENDEYKQRYRYTGMRHNEYIAKRKQAFQWLGERRIVQHGTKLYWLEIARVYTSQLNIVIKTYYRQAQKLNDQERDYVLSLPARIRNEILELR